MTTNPADRIYIRTYLLDSTGAVVRRIDNDIRTRNELPLATITDLPTATDLDITAGAPIRIKAVTANGTVLETIDTTAVADH